LVKVFPISSEVKNRDIFSCFSTKVTKMKQSRTTLSLIVGAAIFLLLLLLTAKVFILSGFERVEEQQDLRSVERVLDIVRNELTGFERSATDWSTWDEPYAFLAGKNPLFPQKNCTPETYAYLKADILLYAGTDGRIVFGRQYNRQTKSLTPLPDGLPGHILSFLRLLPVSGPPKSITGVLLLPEGPLLVSSRRVVDSKGNGPSRGLFFMGRWLGRAEIADFSRISHSAVSITPVTQLPPVLTGRLAHLPPGIPPALVSTVDGTRSVGYGLLRDIYGKPAMVVQLDLPRTVYRTGKEAVCYFIVWILVITVLAVSIGLFLYRKLSVANREKRERDTLYRAVVSRTSEGILLVDAESGVLLEANRGMETMLGFGDGELTGKPLSAITVGVPQALDDWPRNVANGEFSKTTERLFRHREGNTIETEVGSVGVQFKGREIACLSVHNITDRKLAEKALRSINEELEMWVDVRTTELSEANALLQSDIEERKRVETALRKEESLRRTVFNAIPDMITVIDRNFRIIHSNWGGGYDYVPEEVRGTNPYCYDAFYPSRGTRCEPCQAHEAFITGKTVCREKFNPRIGHVEIRAYPIFDETGQVTMVIEHIRDITEHRKLEEESLKSQKLESVGVLAGGIAHDFNNLLTSIMGNIYLAKTLAEPGGKLTKRLDEAEKASKRAANLTQQLLTFSRGGEPIRRCASIEQLVRDSVSFVLRGSNIRCEISIPDDIWPVHVDCGQINQVINNLIMNADQAMPDGGLMSVSVMNVIIGQREATSLSPGKYVKVSVQDRGIGIPPSDLGRIFDPYFTTKAKGSGLGLSSVFSIIKKHGGDITVDSRLGEGATFHFFLPAWEKEPVATDEETAPLDSKKGKVLVMDDEEIIREVVGEMLSHLGYRAEFCGDGAEAIEKYLAAGEAGDPFAVVLMDLTIPGGMGGKETMKCLLEIDTNAIGIVSSGYSNDPILARYHEYGFRGVVQKPYNMEVLGRTLRQVIQQVVNTPA
jgi:PAS domain S-box-containing protein